jgi:ribosome-associated toxin RatA of RatAB toxin-antitoxin module
MRIEHTIDIEASAERVWELTEDVERWPQLTPTITRVERLDQEPLRLGATARIKQPRQRPAVWTVTELDPPQRFAWTTKVFTVTMTGSHHIEPTPSGCQNHLAVELSGFGSTVFGKLFGRQLTAAIATENQGFKKAAEQSFSPPRP